MRKETRFGRAAKLGFLLCAAVGLYFLASTAYALYHFSEFGSENPHFIRYIAVPGAIGAVFLSFGVLPARWSVPVGLYGASALPGLFLFEAFLTYRQIPVWLGMLGESTPLQKMRAEDRNKLVNRFTLLRLNIRAGVDELREAMLSGFPSSNVILCAPGQEVIFYEADRYGFNNPDRIYDAPIDMVLLGDSFVEGFCLPPGQDLASRLRKTGSAAASLGIRGNGPLMEMASLGRFGPVLKPKNVVMVFFEGNDWENLQRELTSPWLRSALSKSADFGTAASARATAEKSKALLQEIKRKPVTIFDLITRRATIRNFFALQQIGSTLGLTFSKIPKDIPEFSAILRRAKNIAESWGGTFSILYVPQVDRFMGAFSVAAPLDMLRSKVRQAAAAQNIRVIDMTDALSGLDDPRIMYGADAHLSALGADFAANLLAREIGSQSHPNAGLVGRGERARYRRGSEPAKTSDF